MIIIFAISYLQEMYTQIAVKRMIISDGDIFQNQENKI